jgi:DNA repair exonuclease SbcCD ATPase subunit
MIPLTLTIKNFRSFKAEQTFHFPEEPGLYFMQGINEVEPRLAGNGTGKSTIWDALFWCLFGKTPKGLKAGDVCNWEAGKGTEVALDFREEGEEGITWTIRRTWGPITWTLSHFAEFITDEEVIDLTKDQSNPVLAALRLEAEPFLNSILTAQGRPMFLDLKHDAQASLFSDVLGLDRWMDYSKRASTLASEQDAKTRELERKHAKVAGQLEATSRQDFKVSADGWEAQRDRQLADLEAEHVEGLAKRKGLKERLEQAQERETNARAWVAKAQPDAGLEKDYGRARSYVADEQTLLTERRVELRAVESHLAHLNDQGICPTCGQGLNKEARLRELGRAEKAQKGLVSMIKAIEKTLDASRDTEARLSAEMEVQETELRQARDELDGAQRDVSSSRRSLELQDRELDRIEDRAEALEEEKNPYKEMEEEARRSGSRLRGELEDLQEQLDASNARYGLLSYWVKGFKELRLQLIAEALTELEIEVNSAVTALGLVDWELKFQVDRETKGGSIQRGFSVLVKSPHNPAPTPWEAWSGGEAQRLRLAGNMGLADLIRARTGTALELEVWDEPTNGLSPQGLKDLLESLETRARNEGRQIWLVDHKAHDFGGFTGTATVIKAPSGSRVRCSWV